MRATLLAEVPKLVLDLDAALAAGMVELDGLPAGFENRDGRIWIEKPAALAPGASFQLAVDYGGRPRVAPNPPWDGGLDLEPVRRRQPVDRYVVPGRGRRPVVALQGPSLGQAREHGPLRQRSRAPDLRLQRKPDRGRGARRRHAHLPLARRQPDQQLQRGRQHRALRRADRDTIRERGRRELPLPVLGPARERGVGAQDPAPVRRPPPLLRGSARTVPVPQREVRRGRDAVPGDGAPDHHRLRQRLPAGRPRLRLVAPPRGLSRMVGEPRDLPRLEGHVAARELRHVHAGAVRREPLRLRGLPARHGEEAHLAQPAAGGPARHARLQADLLRRRRGA